MNLNQQIEQSKVAVTKNQQAVRQITEQLERAQSKINTPEATLDIENATLDEVHAHTKVMDGNIAELIMSLDDITASFSKDFDEMRTKTTAEKFIGFFARGKSETMRQERIRNASIDDKLQDLIAKSTTIKSILDEQLSVIQEQRVKVEANLGQTLLARETTISELESVRAEIQAMDPKIIELESRVSTSTSAVERTKAETELAELNKVFNDYVQQEQVLIARSQTLERYIEAGKTWVDSLQNQAATQMVLINKLDTDTKQRVVLYDALTKSLKTAQQQDVAHRINEIGVRTDQEAQTAMAAIGSATNTRMAEMLEKHEDHMVFARKVLEEKAKADERFARRFSEIVAKHDKSVYEPDQGPSV